MVQITFKLTTFWLHLGNQMKFCILSKPLISVVPLNNMAFFRCFFLHSSCPYRFHPMRMMSFIHVFEPRMNFPVTVFAIMTCKPEQLRMACQNQGWITFFLMLFHLQRATIFSLFLSKPQVLNWRKLSMQKSYGVEWKKWIYPKKNHSFILVQSILSTIKLQIICRTRTFSFEYCFRWYDYNIHIHSITIILNSLMNCIAFANQNSP